MICIHVAVGLVGLGTSCFGGDNVDLSDFEWERHEGKHKGEVCEEAASSWRTVRQAS